MKACTVLNCSRAARTKGLCSLHHHRLVRHGDPEVYQRFYGYGSIDPSTGYWRRGLHGKRMREHRRRWEQAYGPIPRGLVVHHRNGDKLGNRPQKLELMTKSAHAQFHGVERKMP